MKTKYILIIFILFLLLTLTSGLEVFLTEGKGESISRGQLSVVEKQAESILNEQAIATNTLKKIIQSKKAEIPAGYNNQTKEKIKVELLIDRIKYEVAVRAGSSAYELMNLLRAEEKIGFSGKNYSELGFFVENINGIKNNPTGKNWVYYVNGQPAPVGISNYKLKDGDIIEWKFEEKNF